MILRPFFGFFGSKWKLAPLYPTPKHNTIVEPFAGSAGYALRYHRRRVILRDVDPIIVGIWRYLLRSSAAELLALPDLPEGASVDDLTRLPQEARWFIGQWLGASPTSPRKHASKWMRDGRWPTRFWGEATRRRIARQIDQIRHWRVEEGSYEDAPSLEATWFVDPPYQVAGTRYRIGSQHIDFPALASWCRTRRSQVVVCENEGATWLPFQPIAGIQTSRRGKRSLEAAWLGDGHRGPVAQQLVLPVVHPQLAGEFDEAKGHHQ